MGSKWCTNVWKYGYDRGLITRAARILAGPWAGWDVVDVDLSIGGSFPVVMQFVPAGVPHDGELSIFTTFPPDGVGEVFPYGFVVEPPN